MSYDLQVYAREALSREQLTQLVTECGLDIEPEPGDGLTVIRGAKRAYSFTLGLPLSIELEDAPEEVTAVVLAPSSLYELLVEGSSEHEIPHAVKVARRIAQAAGGAVFDQQTGQVWSRGRLRTPPAVARGVVSTVEVRWYLRQRSDPVRAAELWLRAARRWLPEALPRRYGDFEPLQHKLDQGGDDAFVGFVRDADSMVFFQPSKPALSGHLVAGSRTGIPSHGLTLLRDPLDDESWSTALRGLFLDFAAASDCVLATAEVVRGVGWTGRGLWYNGNSERAWYLVNREGWIGPPPEPVWWVWFGPDYVPLVADHLPADQVELLGDGLFHERSKEPQDRDQLAASLMPKRAGLARVFGRRKATAQPWLPPELLPVVASGGRTLAEPISLVPATRRPASLS